MPIYEYACAKCESEFEVEQRITEDPIKTCPRCRSRRVKRLISQTSFALKGGGWYADGYTSNGGKPDGAKPESGATSNGSESKDSASKDSASKDSTSKDSASKDSASKDSASSDKGKGGSKGKKAVA